MSMRTDVLIVEDEVWLAELHTRTLSDAGFSCISVTNGYSAIDAIDERSPRVIILDMFLAGGTAMTLLHEMQSYGDTSKIPVLLCTNTAEHINLRDMKRYGVNRILDKATMYPDDIVTAVRSVL